MRKVIFISILLTIALPGRAQERDVSNPVRVVFTAGFQPHPFGADPVWGGWPEGSLSRAMTYIRSHRRAVDEYHFALVACGTQLKGAYSLYPADFSGRILEYGRYETASYFTRAGLDFAIVEPDSYFDYDPDVRIGLFPEQDTDLELIARTTGIDLAVTAFGREPEVCRVINFLGDTVMVINLGTTGKYIGVADFSSPTEFAMKTVDISGFPVDAEYESHFAPLTDSLHAFYNHPIAVIPQTISQQGYLFDPTSYMTLFHRFQLETTGSAVSFFASPLVRDSIPAGELTFRDLLRRFRYDNRLRVVQLSGEEIRRYLEYAYGLRYNTMRRTSDDLLRLTRDRDGSLQTRSAVYNLDEAGGIRYEVDVSRPSGRRIQIVSMADGSPFDLSGLYRVALNSHRLENGTLSRACGLSSEQVSERVVWESENDYRLLLKDWVTDHPFLPEDTQNWKVVPASFVDAARQREEQ